MARPPFMSEQVLIAAWAVTAIVWNLLQIATQVGGWTR